VYFAGGDQFPYVQLLQADRFASAIISSGANGERAFGEGALAVGGTSAGMAILGGFVFSAEYTRADGVQLTSNDILDNYFTSEFYRPGAPSIAQDVLGINALDGVLTETHFTDPKEDIAPNFRLGRFLSFLGSATLAEPWGLGESSVEGLAVDQKTGITITLSGEAKVWSDTGGHVYFAEASGPSTIVQTADGSGYLETADININWFNADATFDFVDAWDCGASCGQGGYAVYYLDGNGKAVLVNGQLPPPFEQNE
jgi:cyanophycinase-like exopeptidase